MFCASRSLSCEISLCLNISLTFSLLRVQFFIFCSHSSVLFRHSCNLALSRFFIFSMLLFSRCSRNLWIMSSFCTMNLCTLGRVAPSFGARTLLTQRAFSQALVITESLAFGLLSLTKSKHSVTFIACIFMLVWTLSLIFSRRVCHPESSVVVSPRLTWIESLWYSRPFCSRSCARTKGKALRTNTANTNTAIIFWFIFQPPKFL